MHTCACMHVHHDQTNKLLRSNKIAQRPNDPTTQRPNDPTTQRQRPSHTPRHAHLIATHILFAQERQEILRAIATSLEDNTDLILQANKKDVEVPPTPIPAPTSAGHPPRVLSCMHVLLAAGCAPGRRDHEDERCDARAAGDEPEETGHFSRWCTRRKTGLCVYIRI